MMMIAWTTTASVAEAETLANGAVENGLAACAQIDGPMRSVYRWEGKLESSQEFRVTFKLLASQQAGLERWIDANHPYDTPQWIVVEAKRVSEKYLNWAGNGAS
jgi:periplasmic divalent cation tolerance protein